MNVASTSETRSYVFLKKTIARSSGVPRDGWGETEGAILPPANSHKKGTIGRVIELKENFVKINKKSIVLCIVCSRVRLFLKFTKNFFILTTSQDR